MQNTCCFIIHSSVDRVRRALDKQKTEDDERIEMLERLIREASDAAVDSERKFEEVNCLITT